MQPDSSTTDKVRHFPTPTDPTTIRQFVGLASYYRCVVPGFARIAAPLHRLTKKNVSFKWTVECENAFTQLKKILTEAPVLAYPKYGPGETFLLETDACAVLSQQQDDGQCHPIAYASRSLQGGEKNYGITELETLALVWGVKYFRPYILGHHCVVMTDHAACVSVLNTPKPSSKLARWALLIQEIDLEIRHRSGRSNAGADALSRNPVDVATVAAVKLEPSGELDCPSTQAEAWTLSSDLQQKLNEIATLQKSDPELQDMFRYLSEGYLPSEEQSAWKVILESQHFYLVDGVLCHEHPHDVGPWCLTTPVSLRIPLMKDAYDGVFSGHLAEKRVYKRLQIEYWWHTSQVTSIYLVKPANQQELLKNQHPQY